MPLYIKLVFYVYVTLLITTTVLTLSKEMQKYKKEVKEWRKLKQESDTSTTDPDSEVVRSFYQELGRVKGILWPKNDNKPRCGDVCTPPDVEDPEWTFSQVLDKCKGLFWPQSPEKNSSKSRCGDVCAPPDVEEYDDTTSPD